MKRTRTELSRRDPHGRRRAILEAGLAVFAADGFAATKLDDIAIKAGVAKGTIYFHFGDKQDLFEHIVRDAIAPLIARIEEMADLPDTPAEQILGALFDAFRTELLGTQSKDAIRLVLSEGSRFPAIAEFYHREVVSRSLRLIGEHLKRANAKGELSTNGLVEFPQLVFAPLVMSLIWDALFAEIEPLDVKKMLAVHRGLLLSNRTRGADR